MDLEEGEEELGTDIENIHNAIILKLSQIWKIDIQV
jgi:hypothetical protein